jgi:hypothetical protein
MEYDLIEKLKAAMWTNGYLHGLKDALDDIEKQKTASVDDLVTFIRCRFNLVDLEKSGFDGKVVMREKP